MLTFSIPELTTGLAALDWDEWKNASSLGKPAGGDLPAASGRVCDQGADVPFPHLAAAGSRRGADGRVDLAGGRAAQGRNYGLIRFNVGMTPLASASLFGLMATLSVIGIIYGALAALAQTDIKRLVAYSSVSHMGFIVLGIFALNSTALDGSSIQMLNHGLTTGALFACVGMIYERYHTRDITQIGGLWNRLPILALLPDPGGPGLGGRARTERVCRGVSDPGRHVRDERACRRAGGDRDDSGCVLPALDGAEGPVRAASRAVPHAAHGEAIAVSAAQPSRDPTDRRA